MKKLEAVTQEQWNEVCEFNRNLVESFLSDSVELSPKSRKAYESNLKIWFVWVKDNLKNKKQIDIKPLEYKKFQNWMVNRGCSSSDTNNKRAAISSLNGYIEIYYHDDYPTFRNFINKSIKRPPKNTVREKIPLTKEEFRHLVEVLKERGEYQMVAYVLFTFDAGCRREESRQLTKDTATFEPIIKSRTTKDESGNGVTTEIKMYYTKPIRCKGGKIRRLAFGEEAMEAMKEWLRIRGDDDCPYMFVTKYGGQIRQIGETTFNNWFATTITPIVGRPVHPHTLRASRATQAVVEDGKDVESVRQLLGHEDSSTTINFYVGREDDDEVDDLF